MALRELTGTSCDEVEETGDAAYIQYEEGRKEGRKEGRRMKASYIQYEYLRIPTLAARRVVLSLSLSVCMYILDVCEGMISSRLRSLSESLCLCLSLRLPVSLSVCLSLCLCLPVSLLSPRGSTTVDFIPFSAKARDR